MSSIEMLRLAAKLGREASQLQRQARRGFSRDKSQADLLRAAASAGREAQRLRQNALRCL